ncbi:MAG TPA: hydroxymethylglutaryl-CoA reductase, degradative [Pseudomonadota bacterium]|nr:hydroxymethylglutaryl-CoA reductase, degradative [Pseudomonadota bacterium]
MSTKKHHASPVRPPGCDPELISSRVPGFYKLSVRERVLFMRDLLGLPDEAVAEWEKGGLSVEQANHMVENVIGTYALPLGLGLNFQVNGRDYVVPMCVEEPSVIAAASNAARMVREGGGFFAEADPPVMIAQVQLYDVPDTTRGTQAILAEKAALLAACDKAQPGLVRRGGGARDLEVRTLLPSGETDCGKTDCGKTDCGKTDSGMLVVHLLVDCCDAMGANLVNTMAEAVAPLLASLSGGCFGLRILSNLADKRCVRVRCRVPAQVLQSERFDGVAVRDGIVLASRFAELDPYRAATHNKGILNGIDPVVLATGNDWRGVEAGAHAFAARTGVYRPLATWRAQEDGFLHGSLELPLAVGTVGGTLRVHPGARLALKLLCVRSAQELAMVIASVGLASNLAALRALAAEGIQQGHMSLHARSVAVSAGATGEWVELVAAELAKLGDIRQERAEQILSQLQGDPQSPPS